jgi:transposase
LRTVRVEDHNAVIRLLIDRYDGLVSLRTQAMCRLHAVLREVIPGGAPRRLSGNRAARLLRSVDATGLVAIERKRLAVDLLADVRRLDQQIAATRSRITDTVRESKTTLLELHGVGPIVAAYILGHVGNPARFATPERFAFYNGTPPSRRPADRVSDTGSTREGTASSTTPCISSPSPKSATTPPAASTSNASWPRANPRRKPFVP